MKAQYLESEVKELSERLIQTEKQLKMKASEVTRLKKRV